MISREVIDDVIEVRPRVFIMLQQETSYHACSVIAAGPSRDKSYVLALF